MDYGAMLRDALRGVLRAALTQVADTGFPGGHHLFITFDTRAAGVTLPDHMRALYPQEMTVVLQHQFWDMEVTPAYFAVTLSFGGTRHRLQVPFEAVLRFVDPSVPFGLTFVEDLAPAAQPEGGPAERAPRPARPRDGAPDADGDGDGDGAPGGAPDGAGAGRVVPFKKRSPGPRST